MVVILNQQHPWNQPQQRPKTEHHKHDAPAVSHYQTSRKWSADRGADLRSRLIDSHDEAVSTLFHVRPDPAHAGGCIHSLAGAQEKSHYEKAIDGTCKGSTAGEQTPEGVSDNERAFHTVAIHEPSGRNLQGGVTPEKC